MPKYAVIKDGVVTNIVEATANIAQSNGWVLAGAARKGDLHTGADFVSVITGQDLRISPIEFKLLFTRAERVSMYAARETDTELNDLINLVDDTRLQQVDLSLVVVTESLDYLVSKSYITVPRKTAILSGQLP